MWMPYIRISFFVLAIIYVYIYLNIDRIKFEDIKSPLRLFFLGAAWCTGSFGITSEIKAPEFNESMIALVPFILSGLWLFIKIIKLNIK